MLKPDLKLSSILKLSPEIFLKNDINVLLLDIDNTLIEYDGHLSKKVIVKVEDLKKYVTIYLVSNNRDKNKVTIISKQLGVRGFSKAYKPWSFNYFKKNLKNKKVAVCGDQLFTDILFGKLMGAYTILLNPISLENEPLLTKINRFFEKFFL